MLYLANFAVQREFVFQMREASQAALHADAPSRHGEAPPVVLKFRVTKEEKREDSTQRAA